MNRTTLRLRSEVPELKVRATPPSGKSHPEMQVILTKYRGTSDFPIPPRHKKPANAIDYTGFRRGNLVAYSYHHQIEGGKDAGHVWCTRCDCGRYELRKVGPWARKAAKHDWCVYCSKKYAITRDANREYEERRKNK